MKIKIYQDHEGQWYWCVTVRGKAFYTEGPYEARVDCESQAYDRLEELQIKLVEIMS